MALNENSRMLPLLRILNNVKNEAEELCVKAIRDVLIATMICVPIQFLGVFVGRNWLLCIPVFFYLAYSFYLIIHVIPYQFNLQEMRDAIEGDTFKILEVNTELVIIWISKANQVIGRAKIVPILYRLFSILTTFIVVYAALIL